jgi:hypothetical protein
MTAYSTKTAIKDRLLIASTDTSYDTALDTAIAEADRTIDIFLKPYVTVPLTSVSDQIAIISADFASSIFKRRLVPQEVKLRGTLQPDMINDVDGTGWFAVGLKKLLDYIKSYYALAQAASTADAIVNPDVYMELFKNGVLTLKEARALMASSTAVITKRIAETTTAGRTLTNTETDIKDIYHHKRQKSFSFIEGDPDTLGTYKQQEDD